MNENYKVFVFERGIVARHLSKRSAEIIASMWRYKGFRAEVHGYTLQKGGAEE